jgi:hypothetical protein
MRFISTTLGAVALIAAFVAGRASGPHPSQIAAAQETPGPATLAQPVQQIGVVPGASFSHFKCYQTQIKLEKPAFVALRDQFGDERMQLTYADLFCTPVVKRLLNAKPIPVPGLADHLTCYHGEDRPINQTRLVVNQLQRAQITITVPRYLCVPTWKSRGGPQPTPTNFPPRTPPPTPPNALPTPTPTPRSGANPLTPKGTVTPPHNVATLQPRPTPTH